MNYLFDITHGPSVLTLIAEIGGAVTVLFGLVRWLYTTYIKSCKDKIKQLEEEINDLRQKLQLSEIQSAEMRTIINMTSKFLEKESAENIMNEEIKQIDNETE